MTNLGNRLAELERYEEALPVSEEAVAIYRQLAEGSRAHLPGLAIALRNLGNRLFELGREAEAHRAIEETATIYWMLT